MELVSSAWEINPATKSTVLTETVLLNKKLQTFCCLVIKESNSQACWEWLTQCVWVSTHIETQLMKCKQSSFQTLTIKMEFALYELCDTDAHTPHIFKRCNLSASVVRVNIHHDSSKKRHKAEQRQIAVITERKIWFVVLAASLLLGSVFWSSWFLRKQSSV